jgi:hypothetical protein
LNGWATYDLCREYRRHYSAERLLLIDRIAAWSRDEGVAENAFYTVDPLCNAVNDALPWFGPHVRRGASWSGPFRLSDALFPEKSFDLNRYWLNGAAVQVATIPCPVQEVWNARAVIDDWTTGAGGAHCAIRAGSSEIVLTNEHSQTVSGWIRNGHITVPAWGLDGYLAADRETILWTNGTIWQRRTPAALSGAADPMLGAPDTAMPVTSTSQPGFPGSNLADGTDGAWGSATGDRETYAGLRWNRPRQARQIRIEGFSPEGRPHLRDIRVLAADETDYSGRPRWKIVRARMVGQTAYSEKLTVPPLKDREWLTLELDRSDTNWRSHRYWGIGCLSNSRGDERNYLGAGGDGVYLREMEVK